MDEVYTAPSNIATIDRSSAKGFVCSTIQECACFFAHYDFPSQFIISDLSMGVWRSAQVASEFMAQTKNNYLLGESCAVGLTKRADYKNFLSFAQIAGEGIDAESMGDGVLKRSKQMVQEILDALPDGQPKIFLIILPMNASPIYYDNECFIHLFLQALDKKRHTLIFVNSSKNDTPIYKNISIEWEYLQKEKNTQLNHEIAALLPGIVHRSYLKNTDNLIKLNGNCYLVPLESRIVFHPSVKWQFDKLAKQYEQIEHVKAYAIYHGNNYFFDPNFISTYAWKQFHAGAKDIAYVYLSKAYIHAVNLTEKAIILSQLQGFRIALWMFEEASKEPMPASAIPSLLRQFLFLSKGWGSVMTEKLELAALCFSEAEKTFNPGEENSREYLYYLNIKALLFVKNGALKEALSIEKKIESAINTHTRPDYRLLYVNAINMARLYKLKKDFHTSLFYFLQAFQTTVGLKQESDFVYCNLILAMSYESAQEYEKSFYCLLRAVVNWLCTPFPASLSKRLFKVIGIQASQIPNLTEEISSFFIDKLTTHPFASNYFDSNSFKANENIPVFVNAEFFEGVISNAVGRQGFAVFISANKHPSTYTQQQTLLPAITAKILNSLFKNKIQDEVATIVIDNNLGYDIPTTLEELIEVAQRLQVSCIIWEGKLVNLSLQSEHYILADLTISLHPGVQDVIQNSPGMIVRFKRYYSDILVPRDLSSFILKLYTERKPLNLQALFDSLSSTKEIYRMVCQMEKLKLIKLTFNIQTCIKDGFKLHLNVT